MMYPLVRPLARIAIKAYFRKIYLSHAERIPSDKPVLLACNHPTGFMEPCILACFLDRPLYFLVRGDFFAKPHFERMLRALHMLPVFRLRDGGYRKLKENYDTFRACHRALAEHRSIMIFAEGSTELVKRLRPLQQGLARIAFGSLEAYPDLEDVYVVPVGVTYTDANRFRSEVMIDFGEPITVRSFQEEYDRNAKVAMRNLLGQVAEGMSACMVDVRDPAHAELAERLLRIQDSRPPALGPPVFSVDAGPIREARALVAALAALDEDQRADARDRAVRLEERLTEAGLAPPATWPQAAPSAGAWALRLAGWIPNALGRILNFPPIAWIRSIVARQVVRPEFVAPVLVAGGLGIYLVLWLLLVLLLGVLFGWPWILLALLPPLLGRVSVWHIDLTRRLGWARAWSRLAVGEQKALLRQRQALLGLLGRPEKEARPAEGG